MKAAFTSDRKKRGDLSDHFGKAPHIQVYEVGGGKATYMETRTPEALTKPGCNHKSAADMTADVDAVVTAVMGQGAYKQLTGKGIDVYVVEGMSVEDAVERLASGTLIHDPSRIKKNKGHKKKFIQFG